MESTNVQLSCLEATHSSKFKQLRFVCFFLFLLFDDMSLKNADCVLCRLHLVFLSCQDEPMFGDRSSTFKSLQKPAFLSMCRAEITF